MLQGRKTLGSIMEEVMHDQDASGAKLTLVDLLCIGIGSTIGSGVFVLTGKALPLAGPSAVVSWILAGLICLLSSASYMELSARLPAKGSCYVFSYHGLGEIAAVLGSVCLTMEYGISGAGVARSWSAKLSQFLGVRVAVCYNGAEWGNGCNYDDDYYLDPFAAVITLLCTSIVMMGLNMGKIVINSFTAAKILLVAFLIVGGFSCWRWSMFASVEAFAPHGAGGTLSATSLLFFGFVGFDEVCCMASKAANPSKTMPWALVGTLLGTALLSGLAQLALASMAPYSAGMKGTSFEESFRQHGLHWAGWAVSLGELVLLPLVVLLGILPQPEVMAAMSEDGLLPPVFKRRNRKGVYLQGTALLGLLLALIAFAVPFAVLWDIISLGVLFSFNLTNASIINVRYGNGGQLKEPAVDGLAWLLMASMAVAGYTFQRGLAGPFLRGGEISALAVTVGSAALLVALVTMFTIRFAFAAACDEQDKTVFKAFGVPFVPGMAMFFNFFLMADFSWSSFGFFAAFLVCFLAVYFVHVSSEECIHRQTAGSDGSSSLEGEEAHLGCT